MMTHMRENSTTHGKLRWCCVFCAFLSGVPAAGVPQPSHLRGLWASGPRAPKQVRPELQDPAAGGSAAGQTQEGKYQPPRAWTEEKTHLDEDTWAVFFSVTWNSVCVCELCVQDRDEHDCSYELALEFCSSYMKCLWIKVSLEFYRADGVRQGGTWEYHVHIFWSSCQIEFKYRLEFALKVAEQLKAQCVTFKGVCWHEVEWKTRVFLVR